MINKQERKILNTNIPVKNKRYQWSKAKAGDYIDFIYGKTKGRLIIKENLKNKLLIEYNNKEKEISYDKIKILQIGDLVGVLSHEFKYDINYTYSNNKGTYIVVDRIREHDAKIYKVKCLKCGYIFTRKEFEITQKMGCPVCTNQIVIKGINDMWTTAPEIAKLLKNPEDGYRYMKNSNVKLEWECPDCGNLINKVPYVVGKYGLGCHRCSNGRSYPNRFIFVLLETLNIKFKSEKIFNWSEGRIYDFYLSDYNIIIEAHGIQHYEYCGFPIDVEEQQKIDRYKEKLASKNKINKYIIIDCRYSDAEYIIDNIKNSLIGKMFDLSKIDIKKLDKESRKKIIFEIAELYKNGLEVAKIAEKYDLCVKTVYKYLHKAENFDTIEFNYEKTNKLRSDNSRITYYQNNSVPIKCEENEYYFGGLALIEQYSEQIFNKNFFRSTICAALKNNKKAYGYTFKYITREEFNNQKDINPDKTFGDKFIDITINKKEL